MLKMMGRMIPLSNTDYKSLTKISEQKKKEMELFFK